MQDASMVGRRATRKEIETFVAEGWTFRKKYRKDKLYVSARKGSREKGLGRYSDEYWATIMSAAKGSDEGGASPQAKGAQTGSEGVSDPLIMAWKEVERNLHTHIFVQCLHREADYFCGYWLLEDLPRHGKQLGQRILEGNFKRVKSVDGVTHAWAFKPTVGICISCPVFAEGKNIKSSKFPSARGLPRGIMPIYHP